IRYHHGPQHLSLEEGQVVVDGPGDVRLRREVHDGIGLRHQGVHELAVSHIAVPEAQARVRALGQLLREILDTPRIGEGVDHGEVIGRILGREMADEVASDEARPARDENVPHVVSSSAVWMSPSTSIPRLSRPWFMSRSTTDRYGTKSPWSCAYTGCR